MEYDGLNEVVTRVARDDVRARGSGQDVSERPVTPEARGLLDTATLDLSPLSNGDSDNLAAQAVAGRNCADVVGIVRRLRS
jgi:hypothetical protein